LGPFALISLACGGIEMSGGVFICYRREETAFAARAIHDRVVQRLERENVFLDVDNIDLGVDWFNVLTDRVGACDALVAVIGRNWVSSADKDGLRRLDDPDDFVRIEIEAALKRDVRVIPILVDGAAMPKASELPDSLKNLARRQGIEVSPARFDADVEKLTRALVSILEARRSRDAAEAEAAHRAEAEHRAREAGEAERVAREEWVRQEAAEAARAEEARGVAEAKAAHQAEEERRAREAERATREERERREVAEAARVEEARRVAEVESARRAEEDRRKQEAVEAERIAREERERCDPAAARAEEARRLSEAESARRPAVEGRAREAADATAAEAKKEANENTPIPYQGTNTSQTRPRGDATPTTPHRQYQTGNAYFYGIGGVNKPNEHEGIVWFLKAANQGHADAQFKLGQIYENGFGVATDYKKAKEWYEKAADQRHANAQYALGWLYENGRGTVTDCDKAKEWYRKAADQRDKDYMEAMIKRLHGR
jgi:TPR repeat protein